MKPAYGPIVAIAVVAMLAGCVPEAAPVESPSPAAPTSAAPSPSPTVEFVPLVLPECEVLLPLSVAQDNFSPETVLLGDLPPAEFTGRSSIPSIGPTFAAAPIARVCSYGVPDSDGAFFVAAAEVTAAQREALQSDLTAAATCNPTMALSPPSTSPPRERCRRWRSRMPSREPCGCSATRPPSKPGRPSRLPSWMPCERRTPPGGCSG